MQDALGSNTNLNGLVYITIKFDEALIEMDIVLQKSENLTNHEYARRISDVPKLAQRFALMKRNGYQHSQ